MWCQGFHFLHRVFRLVTCQPFNSQTFFFSRSLPCSPGIRGNLQVFLRVSWVWGCLSRYQRVFFQSIEPSVELKWGPEDQGSSQERTPQKVRAGICLQGLGWETSFRNRSHDFGLLKTLSWCSPISYVQNAALLYINTVDSVATKAQALDTAVPGWVVKCLLRTVPQLPQWNEY